jgi:hypothetical protein
MMKYTSFFILVLVIGVVFATAKKYNKYDDEENDEGYGKYHKNAYYDDDEENDEGYEKYHKNAYYDEEDEEDEDYGHHKTHKKYKYKDNEDDEEDEDYKPKKHKYYDDEEEDEDYYKPKKGKKYQYDDEEEDESYYKPKKSYKHGYGYTPEEHDDYDHGDYGHEIFKKDSNGGDYIPHLHPRYDLLQDLRVEGIVSDKSKFVGTLTVTGAKYEKNTLYFKGYVIEDGSTKKILFDWTPGSIEVPLEVEEPKKRQVTPPGCSILNLVLGPLNLNLLGLVVSLNTVVLNIVANTGANNLLGNLLCGIAGLLNNTSLAGLTATLTGILNGIVSGL